MIEENVFIFKKYLIVLLKCKSQFVFLIILCVCVCVCLRKIFKWRVCWEGVLRGTTEKRICLTETTLPTVLFPQKQE